MGNYQRDADPISAVIVSESLIVAAPTILILPKTESRKNLILIDRYIWMFIWIRFSIEKVLMSGHTVKVIEL